MKIPIYKGLPKEFFKTKHQNRLEIRVLFNLQVICKYLQFLGIRLRKWRANDTPNIMLLFMVFIPAIPSFLLHLLEPIIYDDCDDHILTRF